MVVAKISAAVMAYQMPSTSKISGRMSTEAVWNTSVRRKEIAAEINPFSSAVKNDEAKILKPANKNVANGMFHADWIRIQPQMES